jgi:flagellar motor switch protein FliN/FliY
MADEKEIGQDEIEALLKQAQDAAGDKPAEASAPPPSSDVGSDDGGEIGQDEIEALLQGGKAPAAATKPKPAAAAEPHRDDDGEVDQNDIDLLLANAERALASIDQPADGLPPGVVPFKLEDFSGATPSSEAASLDLMRDVQLDMKIELGRTHMYLEDVLRLRKGSVVALDKLAGDPVDIYVNGRLIARGEVLVLNDNFCVRVAELIAGENIDAA